MHSELRLPNDPVYTKSADGVVFNQLALKIQMDAVANEQYFSWLDGMRARIGDLIPGACIVEKDGARHSPPLNTAVYYDTADYKILPTGALLRTSCNKITHAFCAFKMTEDRHAVRRDHRYVFADEEKRAIQADPTSQQAVAIVKRLLLRNDIKHPGSYLESELGIKAATVFPALALDDYRFTFFCWLDGQDALRCSVDRAYTWNLRGPPTRDKKSFSEVELAIYPRVSAEVARDERVPRLIQTLAEDLCDRFETKITKDIKYQRAAKQLGLFGRQTCI